MPLTIDSVRGRRHVAVVGAPQTATTALRTLIMALAATHDVRRVQFYCLTSAVSAGPGGRTAACGAVAGRAQPGAAISRMLAELSRPCDFGRHSSATTASTRWRGTASCEQSRPLSLCGHILGHRRLGKLRQEFAALRSRSLPWQLKGFHSAYMWRYRQHGGGDQAVAAGSDRQSNRVTAGGSRGFRIRDRRRNGCRSTDRAVAFPRSAAHGDRPVRPGWSCATTPKW